MTESGDWQHSVPAISIVVRTIGNPLRLGEALESLARQTRRDFEVVVVDMSGGANDRVLEEYAARLPALRRLTSARCSRPAALNAGIAAASAPLIGILDDDNLYDPEQLEIFLSGLAGFDAGYVYAGVRHATYNSDGRPISSRDCRYPFDFLNLINGNFIYATGSAFRKSLWQRLGGYDERFVVFEDWDFIIRAAEAGAIVHLPTVTGESRKFTGIEGASNFHAEISAVRKCHAGIYWKHRHLYADGDRRAIFCQTYAGHCALRKPARRGLLAHSLGGWRLEFFADLSAWFAHDLWMRLSGKPARLTGSDRPNRINAAAEARA